MIRSSGTSHTPGAVALVRSRTACYNWPDARMRHPPRERAMPSAALLRWQTDRLPRLAEVDAQCAATLAVVPPPALADENLRGYVMLLSAHFQGYCRDLHTECVQVVAAASASPAIEVVVQTQGIAGRELDGANPRYETLRK